MSIRIDKLTKSFLSPATTALAGRPPIAALAGRPANYRVLFEDLSLDLTGVGIFALTGPNGSGKTTLLKILATLILPSSGTAYICGNSILDKPQETRQCIGFAYDAERSFYQPLTLNENLRFFARLYGMRGQAAVQNRIDEMLEVFGLGEWKDMPVSKCSSGIKQKAALARALMPSPKVLLVDEVSRSLDETSRKEVSLYIKEYVKRNNASCLLVTHDMNEAKTLADAAGRLENGKLILIK